MIVTVGKDGRPTAKPPSPTSLLREVMLVTKETPSELTRVFTGEPDIELMERRGWERVSELDHFWVIERDITPLDFFSEEMGLRCPCCNRGHWGTGVHYSSDSLDLTGRCNADDWRNPGGCLHECTRREALDHTMRVAAALIRSTS